MDQLFAQVALAIARACFNDPDDVVEVLSRLCRGVKGSVRANAYKLDQVACWKEWVAHLRLKLKGLHDCHYLRICRREDIGLPAADWGHGHDGREELCAEVQDFAPGVPRSGGDIVIVAKQWMADRTPTQVLALVPAVDARRVLENRPDQPSGVAMRRPIGPQVIRSIRTYAPQAAAAGFISEAGASYLQAWVDGIWPRYTRPREYSFLEHRWRQAPAAVPPLPPHLREASAARPIRVVRMRGARGAAAAAAAADSDEDVDPGQVM